MAEEKFRSVISENICALNWDNESMGIDPRQITVLP